MSRMHIPELLLAALLCAALGACQPAGQGEVLRFAVVADRTGGERKGVFDAAIDKLNLLAPEFVLCVGDLIEGYTEDPDEIDRQWDEFDELLSRLKMPFYRVPGNHDLTNPVQVGKWGQRYGPTYYSFARRGVLFLCLDSVSLLAGGPAAGEQVRFVRRTLAANRTARWTFVLLHHPLWTWTKPVAAWTEIEQALKDRPHTVFAGHYHSYTAYERHGQSYLILATTGGSNMGGPPPFGAFDHIVWVTAGREGPTIANLTCDGIWDRNVRTEATAARLNRLRAQSGVFADALFADSDVFGGATATLRLVNPEQEPMKLTATVKPAPGMTAAPTTMEDVIPPDTTRRVELRLKPDSPLPVGDVPPVVIESSISIELPGLPTLELQRSFRLGVERILDCPRIAQAVVIDGRLDEWKNLAFSAGTSAKGASANKRWTGPEDSTFRFAIAHDDRNVYLAVETTDDKVLPDQDMVQVRLDARPEPARSAGRGENPMTDHLVISVSPGAKEMLLHDRDVLPAGTQVACVAWDKGIRAEFAIPAAYLDARQGGRWSALRLNVMIDDYDEPRSPVKLLRWQPTWSSPTNRIGSGTFRRLEPRP